MPMNRSDDMRRDPSPWTAWALALIFLVSYALSFPPFGLWWMILLAPVAFALMVMLPIRARSMLLPVFVSSCLLWGWFHWWISGVTSAGYVPMVVYLAAVTTMSAVWLRVLVRGRASLPVWLALPLTVAGAVVVVPLPSSRLRV